MYARCATEFKTGFLRNSTPAPPNRGLFLSGGGVGGGLYGGECFVCEELRMTTPHSSRQGM
ncbi:hypothetical protein GQ55_3G277600 [Panicum hallii var. hallii]|uniref:Uncharacterized protein n=1 Tax=Panicum hallii var. hallii TaxID=1504633 RepID=A0A2T7EE15_9POAL|nr:hypothetical protein GQ55_3G277600 [Panicum hallii var. hallii]